jgi:hypothetical protein
MLMRIFVRLWLKKKEEMLVNNLRKLAEAFNTLEDPVLIMKRTSVKQGVQGAIAFSQSHGKKWTGKRLALPMFVPFRRCLGFSRR